jgi:hypothetical protein
MTKPIPDIRTGFSLILERLGDEDVRKSVHMHIKFGLFRQHLKRVSFDRSSYSKGRHRASRSTRGPSAAGAIQIRGYSNHGSSSPPC